MIGQTNAIEKINSRYSQLINYTMLYDSGNECIEVTGGWGSTCAIENGKTLVSPTKETDGIFMSLPTTAYRQSLINTVNTVSLSQYSKMLLKYKITSANKWGGFELRTSLTQTSGTRFLDTGNGNASGSGNVGNYLKIIDINAGTGYLALSIAKGSTNDGTGAIKLYEWIVFRSDDWQTLANLAGITASSINDILTSSSTLLNNQNAVEFMIYNCTGDFMAKAITSSTFLTALNNSPYKTLVYSNEHWSKFLGMVA